MIYRLLNLFRVFRVESLKMMSGHLMRFVESLRTKAAISLRLGLCYHVSMLG